MHVESIEPPEGVEIPYDVNFTILTLVAPAVEEEEPVEEEELEEGEEAVEGEEGAEEEDEEAGDE